MNCSTLIGAILFMSLFLPSVRAGEMKNAGGPKAAESAHPASDGSARESQALMRRLAEITEQARAELKLSREQNDKLAQLLLEAREDLQEMRRELLGLRSERAAVSTKTAEAHRESENPPAISSPDALKERLSRVEDQVQVHTAQIREQSQIKVESDSRFGIRLFGMILGNAFYNSGDSSEEAVPTLVPPTSARVANGGRNFGSTFRQSSFGFSLSGPKLGQGTLSADAAFDFYGGAPDAYGSEMLGGLRMRTAHARWEAGNSSLVFGLMEPMISPLSPSSLASLYYPSMSDSGNLWQWRPQFTAERRMAIEPGSSLILQGGIMLPFGETYYGRGLEGKPGYETRVAFVKQANQDHRLEFGMGAYVHPQGFGQGRTVNSYAVTTDWIVPLHPRAELSGEFYYGQSITLGEPAGADVSRVFGFSGPMDSTTTQFRGIHDFGGWSQLKLMPSRRMDFNFAFGIDDPRNNDLFPFNIKTTARFRNRTAMANTIYRLRSNLQLSLEYRNLQTVYPDAKRTNNHYNLAIAYFF
jgi:hypothetical protein